MRSIILDICLLGTGGMMPPPHHQLTAMIARYEGSDLLIGYGEGTQVALKEKGWNPKPIDVICFTHYHANHISGLPGLLLAMGSAERTESLVLIGPRGLEQVVDNPRTITPELPFGLRFIELAEPREQVKIGLYVTDAFRVSHNAVYYGYSISIPRAGRFDMERAKGRGVPIKAWSHLQKGEALEMNGVVYTPDMVLGPARHELKVTYCTDTRPVPVVAECAREADLFICERMYGKEGEGAKAGEHKHMTFYEVTRLAKEAQPKCTWLTHYSPSLTRPEEFMDEMRKIFPQAIVAKDGRTIKMGYSDQQ